MIPGTSISFKNIVIIEKQIRGYYNKQLVKNALVHGLNKIFHQNA